MTSIVSIHDIDHHLVIMSSYFYTWVDIFICIYQDSSPCYLEILVYDISWIQLFDNCKKEKKENEERKKNEKNGRKMNEKKKKKERKKNVMLV